MDLPSGGLIVCHSHDARETDVLTGRFDDLCHRGGHRGIDGVAFVLQDLEPGLDGLPPREPDDHPTLPLSQERVRLDLVRPIRADRWLVRDGGSD